MGDISADDQARIFYLVLLAVFVASGLLYGYRDRLGTALQHLLIWALIIVGFVIVFAFKDPLLSALNPSRVQQSGDALVLNRANDGHFYARALVNGVGVDFLVDTGATDIVLSRADAARAGIDINALAFSQTVETANGQIRSAPVRLRELRFGPLSASGISASVNGGELSVGLLGMRFLERFRSITFVDDQMILVP